MSARIILTAGFLALSGVSPAHSQIIAEVPPADSLAIPELVLEGVEVPEEIALGTMTVKFWARLRLASPVGTVGGATLVFPEGETSRHIEMRPVDGAFDSPREEAVGTVDTYLWPREGVHPWEIRASAGQAAPRVVGEGTLRVKGRIATPDLVLFDERGAAQAWIGSGAGGFAPAPPLEAGAPSAPPALADIDGDGWPDLVWPVALGRVHVWRNRGAGRFEVTRTLDLGAEIAASAVGDVDGDGRADLVTASLDRVLEIRSGLGAEADFATELTLLPDRMALADLDGDGRPEICLALLGLQQGEVQLWSRPGGRGGGWSPVARLEPPEGGRGRVLHLAGLPPAAGAGLLVASSEGGEGTLESWGPPADTDFVSTPVCRARWRVPGEPAQVVAGRFSDDAAWLAVVREGTGAVLVGNGEGAGLRRFGSLVRVPEAIGVLDLDGDGDDDLVTGGEDLRLWINVWGEGFREAGESPYPLETPVVELVAGRLDERES